MDRSVTKIDNRTLRAIPRGWIILGLAIASWGLTIAAAMLARNIFNYVASGL